MKCFIALVTYLAYASASYNLPLSSEQIALAIKFGTECAQMEGISQEQAYALRDGNFDDADDKMKCFVHCILEKSDFFEDDKIQPAVVLAKLGPLAGEDVVKEAQQICDSIKGIDSCDTAFQVFECYYGFDMKIHPLEHL